MPTLESVSDKQEIMQNDIQEMKLNMSLYIDGVTRIESALREYRQETKEIYLELKNMNRAINESHNRILTQDKDLDNVKYQVRENQLRHQEEMSRLEQKISETQVLNKEDRNENHKMIMEKLDEIDHNQRKMENRIIKLENWKWYLMGIAAFIGFVITSMPWDILISLISH